MNEIETLAIEAATIMDTMNGYGEETLDGEYGDRWRSLYNTWAGQSRVVLHHVESGYVFKNGTGWLEPVPVSNSKRYVGTIEITDDHDEDEGTETNVTGVFPIRLPEFYYVDVPEWGVVEVSEYVEGNTCCSLRGGWCAHAYAMVKASGCADAHNGNYLISNDEVVLFDFDGIKV